MKPTNDTAKDLAERMFPLRLIAGVFYPEVDKAKKKRKGARAMAERLLPIINDMRSLIQHQNGCMKGRTIDCSGELETMECTCMHDVVLSRIDHIMKPLDGQIGVLSMKS